MIIDWQRVGTILIILFFAGGSYGAQAKEAVLKDKGTAVSRNFTFKLRVDGFDRFYTVHVPPGYDTKARVPVVVMFHGGGGSSRAAQFETGWDAKADQETFLMVYPDALPPDTARPSSFRHNPQLWNDGSGRYYQCRVNVDDVGFTKAMLDDVGKRYKVNTRRVYATGFSNGASMAFRVGAVLSQRFAAIAPVAGACWLERIQLKHMVPLCYITGTTDSLNKIEGEGFHPEDGKNAAVDKKAKPPVRESIHRWGAAMNCPAKPQTTTQEKGVRTETYAPCRDGADMIFVTVDGLGHTWPGGKSVLPDPKVGKRPGRLKANDFIWDFFKQHEISSPKK